MWTQEEGKNSFSFLTPFSIPRIPMLIHWHWPHTAAHTSRSLLPRAHSLQQTDTKFLCVSGLYGRFISKQDNERGYKNVPWPFPELMLASSPLLHQMPTHTLLWALHPSHTEVLRCSLLLLWAWHSAILSLGLLKEAGQKPDEDRIFEQAKSDVIEKLLVQTLVSGSTSFSLAIYH